MGGLSIQRGETPLADLNARKAGALLVYLLSQRQPQAREVLTALRKNLGPYLVITRETVALNPEQKVWLDAAALEAGLDAMRATGVFALPATPDRWSSSSTCTGVNSWKVSTCATAGDLKPGWCSRSRSCTIQALVYFGTVVLLEGLLRGLSGEAGQLQLVTVVSTLAIAALFTPLRRRIQDFIDQRFYRQKYNTEFEDFGALVGGDHELLCRPSQLFAWLPPDVV